MTFQLYAWLALEMFKNNVQSVKQHNGLSGLSLKLSQVSFIYGGTLVPHDSKLMDVFLAPLALTHLASAPVVALMKPSGGARMRVRRGGRSSLICRRRWKTRNFFVV